MRIGTVSAKGGFFLVAAVVIFFPAILLAAASYQLGFAWAILGVVAATVVAARTFRGPGESDAPRRWWKMTSTRGGGLLLALVFFISAVSALVGVTTSPDPQLSIVGGVVALVIAAFFVNSALRTHDRAAHPVPSRM